MHKCAGTHIGDRTGYYTEKDPDVHRMSIRWSNAIHRDPEESHVFAVMDQALRTSIESHVSPGSLNAQLAAAKLVRAALARVIAHRVAMHLAPNAVALLSGDDSAVRKVLDDPSAKVVAHPRAGIRTDFARVWFGDDARLLFVLGTMTHQASLQTLDELPLGLGTGVRRAGEWVTEAAKSLVKDRGLEAKESRKIDGRWSEEPRGNFVIDSASTERVKWNQSFLIDGLANGIKMSAREFALHNAEAATEHIVAFLSDCLHGFAGHPRATTSDRVSAVIDHLHLTSALAFMGNRKNAEAEYKDRYVWADDGHDGPRTPRRAPMVLVTGQDSRYVLVPNPDSHYADASRAKRNNCPGPDGLEPLASEVAASSRLRNALKSALPGRDDASHCRLDRHFSLIDVVTALGVATAVRLMKTGFATFDDVASHLRSPDSARSTGAFIFVPPVGPEMGPTVAP